MRPFNPDSRLFSLMHSAIGGRQTTPNTSYKRYALFITLTATRYDHFLPFRLLQLPRRYRVPHGCISSNVSLKDFLGMNKTIVVNVVCRKIQPTA